MPGNNKSEYRCPAATTQLDVSGTERKKRGPKTWVGTPLWYSYDHGIKVIKVEMHRWNEHVTTILTFTWGLKVIGCYR